MPTKDYKSTKLNKEEARKLIIKLAGDGKVLLSNHARERMVKREVIVNDVMNVLLSQSMRVLEGEFENGSYRYRCTTKNFVVVIGFLVRGDGLVVVSVFKAERKA